MYMSLSIDTAFFIVLSLLLHDWSIKFSEKGICISYNLSFTAKKLLIVISCDIVIFIFF
jgi:hypothetical protein